MQKTILCLDFNLEKPIQRLRLDGIRRYAKAHGWEVDVESGRDATPDSLPEILARCRPVGCIAECWAGCVHLPPRLFGALPVVHFDPPETAEFRNAATVECDNAAVAAVAFRELSAGLPPSYAVMPFAHPHRWALERVEAFRALCRENGCPCLVFPDSPESEAADGRAARLASWAARLPPHCAIFAVSDLAANEIAGALAAAGRPVPRTAMLVGADAAVDRTSPSDRPAISSVKIDFELAGFLAARLLAEKIESPSAGASPSSGAATFGPLLVERRQTTSGRGRREPHILRAVEMIRREACDGLTAAALAARFRVSRAHFERRFREATGHSVLDEILHVRMENAEILLARRDIAIGTIYFRCGFATGRELRSLFLSRMRVSMRKWRKDHAR